MSVSTILKQLGLSEKETQVYLALLNAGPSSVRTLANTAGVNRGTTYDILKILIKRGLASYYHQDKRQYFLAEDPEKLKNFLQDRMHELEESKSAVEKIIPELKSVYNRAEDKPVVKYYQGTKGVKTVLGDVLEVMTQANEKEYYVYSASNIRQHLYDGFPNFAKERVKRKIRCKVIAVGSGGQLWGMDERKWLSKTEGSPTYMIIYYNKLGLISLDKNKQTIGMIISDPGLYQTNMMIFKYVWKTLI
ncbi:MAG: helix-turn-helix domain-containing protein [Patescibacteria group bacterium]|jgi:sugar-specific transcriptional regulator TrmB